MNTPDPTPAVHPHITAADLRKARIFFGFFIAFPVLIGELVFLLFNSFSQNPWNNGIRTFAIVDLAIACTLLLSRHRFIAVGIFIAMAVCGVIVGSFLGIF